MEVRINPKEEESKEVKQNRKEGAKVASRANAIPAESMGILQGFARKRARMD